MYPYQNGGGPINAPPAFDQYGNQANINPLVGRSTAGAMAPGQSLISAAGREATSNSVAITFPLFTVPAGKTFFLTDFQISTIGTVEVDTQVQAGSIPIARAATSSTSPIGVIFETQPIAPGGVVVSIVLPVTASSFNVDFYVAGYFQANPGNY